MTLRLWAKIGITLIVNLVLLALLFVGLLLYQARSGFESLLLSPAQERIRAIGSAVASQTRSQRADTFAQLERQYGVQMLLYDRDGMVVEGQDRNTPAAVMREIRRPPQRPFERETEERRGSVHPVFLVQDREHSFYWVGVHIPVETGERTVRHALVFVTPTLVGNTLFFDWRPWALGLLAALLVSLGCWLPLVRGILHSIHLMRAAAGQIAGGHFDVAVPVHRKDELGDLATSVSKMAENLSRLVHGQRRFLADVAHELCAPLSRIQLSSGILEHRVSGESREYVRNLERDVRHMSNLVGDLLSFSKGAVRKAELKDLALAGVVNEVVASEVNESAKVQVKVDPAMTVLADEEYLRRALANLVRNAVNYAGDSGPIEIAAGLGGRGVWIAVRDQGPGLPDSELQAVFEPFYRPDPSREQSTGGAGLGLAIVKGCVEACGGSVSCRNRSPKGLEVKIELRAAA